MNASINFSKMEFYDFYSLHTDDAQNNYTVMCDDCYMCQECYYR